MTLALPPNPLHHQEALFLPTYVMYPIWALMMAAPRWRLTQPLATATALGLSLLYSVLSLSFGLTGQSRYGFRNVLTYAGVSATLQQQEVMLPVWCHMITTDLWMGIWQVKDATKRGMPRWSLAPCLGLTMFAGPLGMLSYLGTRHLLGTRSAQSGGTTSGGDHEKSG